MAAFSASKIALVLAVAQCLMSFIKADNFPLIYWHQALKPPLSVTNGFNAPSCADTEGSDGDVDCYVGTENGTIQFWKNTGSSSAFVFTRDSNGDVSIDGASFVKPCVLDFDGDGDYDMFVGAADGSVLLRTANDDGSYGDTDDVFALASEAYLSAAGGSGLGALRTLSGRSHVALPLALSGLASVAVGAGFFPFLPMVPGLGASAGASAWVHGTYAAPSCADLDGDGDIDCLVGYFEGNVVVFLNEGTTDAPVFTVTVSDLLGSGDDDTLRHASPFVRDFDFDGDLDLLVGFEDGSMRYYENTANNVTAPSSSGYYALKSTDLFTSKDKIGYAYASPWCGQTDADANGYIECIVGTVNTTFLYDSELPSPTSQPTFTPQPSLVPTAVVPEESVAQMLSGDVSSASTSTLVVGAIAFLFFLGSIVYCGVRCASNSKRGPLAANDEWQQGHGGGGHQPHVPQGFHDPNQRGGGIYAHGSGMAELTAWGDASKQTSGVAQYSSPTAHGAVTYGGENVFISDGAIQPHNATVLYPAEMTGVIPGGAKWASNPTLAYPAQAPMAPYIAVAEAAPVSKDPAAAINVAPASASTSEKTIPPPLPPPPAAIAAAASSSSTVSIDSLAAAEDSADAEAEQSYVAPSAQDVMMEERVAAEQAKLSAHQENVSSI